MAKIASSAVKRALDSRQLVTQAQSAFSVKCKVTQTRQENHRMFSHVCGSSPVLRINTVAVDQVQFRKESVRG